MSRCIRSLCAFAALLLSALAAANASETITYTYDALGRLVEAESSGDVNDGQVVATTFDPVGNRTNQTVTGAVSSFLSISGASATEGSNLVFTVTRTGVTTGASSASYATASGSATSGSDFTTASGTVSFASGETTKTITVSTTDDGSAEPVETMSVTLSSPSGALLNTASATGTINDNDSGGTITSVTYSASSTLVGESYTGLSGSGAGMRDGVYDTDSSVHGTNNSSEEWIMMDLGSVQTVGDVVVVASAASGGWSSQYLNGAVLEKSSDGLSWTSLGSISGATDNVPYLVPVNSATRYVRVHQYNFNWLGVGDFYATSGLGSAVLSIGDASVTEGGNLVFTVTRSGTTSTAASASYATASGSATSGSDFTAASGTVSFAPGETSKTITVATTDDGAAEFHEKMNVTLSSPAAGTWIGHATGLGMIEDNDSAPTIIPVSYSASSTWSGHSYTGLSGTGAGMRDGIYDTASSVHGTNNSADEWIMMDLGSVQTVKDVVLAGSTETEWDIVDLNGAELERSSDGSTWTSIGTISGASDNVPFAVAVNTSARYLRLHRASYLWIGVGDFYATADPAGPSAVLSIGDAVATEGGNLVFTVTRSGTTTGAASASYATASGTATSGSDFTAASGTVSFASGETSKTITVATTDDGTAEFQEGMTVTLSSPSAGATIGTPTGTGTINDNDSGSTITSVTYSASSTLTGHSYTGLSGSGAGMRDGVYNADNSVHGTNNSADEWVMMDLGSVQTVGDVVLAGSTATDWDIVDLNGVILEKSNDGSSWTSLGTISGAKDNVPFLVSVNAATRYLRLHRTGYLWIGVGDFYATSGSGAAILSIFDTGVTEGGDLVFTVTRSGTASTAASASYATSGGSATSGTDFTAASGTVSFAPGETSKTITVSTADDGTAEPTEKMSVTLSSPSSGAWISNAIGTGTIEDDDSGTIIIPVSYSASSTWSGGSYTGLTGNGAGMRDGVYDLASSTHGTENGADEWIMMDLGSVEAVGYVILAGSTESYWDIGDLNGAALEKSTDGSSWTSIGTISGASDHVPFLVSVNASTRYLRLHRTDNLWLGVGDFYATTDD